MINFALTFSDAAKFADVARNIAQGNGFVSSFSFAGGAPVILPFTPYSIALFYKIFGVNDSAVIINSAFYFLLTLLFTFLLTKKLLGSKLISVVSALSVGFCYDLLKYAGNGASESPFIAEIIAAFYFASLKKKWANILIVLIGGLMYFTRPQAFIFILGIIFYKLLLNYNFKKSIKYFLAVFMGFILIDFFITPYISAKYNFIYSVLARGTDVAQIAAGSMGSSVLRSGMFTPSTGLIVLIKKVLYDLYNFYKALPVILNPYLFFLFILGIIIKHKNKKLWAFNIAAHFCILATFFITAAGIPAYRYIHPVIPLVFILGVINLNIILSVLQYKGKMLNIILISIILIFAAGQSMGIFLLDSRFEAKSKNINKPHIYKILSESLKDNSNLKSPTLTNLDTWGSWYGNTKTVWYPESPREIVNAKGDIAYGSIYLTSYLMDDENYYMGEDWRKIFENPTDKNKWDCAGCREIADQFELKGIYKIAPADNYENSEATGVLLTKK